MIKPRRCDGTLYEGKRILKANAIPHWANMNDQNQNIRLKLKPINKWNNVGRRNLTGWVSQSCEHSKMWNLIAYENYVTFSLSSTNF